MKRWLQGWLRDAPRWLFLAALVYAPWAYGGTTKESIAGTNLLLGIALLFWMIALPFQRKAAASAGDNPISSWRMPRLFLITSAALLILGWFMTANAVSIYDSQFYVFIPVRHWIAHPRGSVDYAISAAWMLRATLLLAVVVFVADLSRDSRWLLRLWWTIALAGGSIALLGLLQKATGAEMIFWQPAPASAHGVKAFFATYYYHANAGAFLNLTMPFAIGLAVRTFQKQEPAGVRALWLGVSVIMVVAVAANTSRMSELIALGLILTLAIKFSPDLFRGFSRTERSLAGVGAVVVLITLFAVAQASRLDLSMQRWQTSHETLSENGRLLASRAALTAIPDAGAVGFGPGTFRVVFPYYTAPFDRITGVWRFLHNDYLQTLLEWGWLGGALWGFLFFGGMAAGVRNWLGRKNQNWSPRYRLLLPLVIFSLAGIALHALVDFPLQILSLQLYAATYLGLGWGSGNWARNVRAES
ncbi:MAG: hypothetical protein QOI22_560 [Verrucomicrobiota bacterium]